MTPTLAARSRVDRRDWLKLCAAAGLALGLSPRALLAEDAPAFAFAAGPRALLSALADTLIPATDTPGAVEAGVVEFIEVMVGRWLDEGERDAFLRDLAAFDARMRQVSPGGFAAMSPAGRLGLLTLVQGETTQARRPDGPVPFFLLLKRLVVFGYYTSEIGASQELTLNMAAAQYDPCAHVDPHAHGPSLAKVNPVFPLSDHPVSY